MLKIVISVSILLSLLSQTTYAKLPTSEEFMNKLRQQVAQVEVKETTCVKTSDCPDGFFCKSYNCVAKKREEGLCLSGSNDECSCGQCQTIQHNWNSVCLQDDDDKCPNNGLTSFNHCKHNSDCPEHYYCDHHNEFVCTSKLPPGRSCHNNEMCSCDRCVESSYFSRKHMTPLQFKVCDSC